MDNLVWAALVPQTLRRPTAGVCEGDRAGRGQAILSQQLCVPTRPPLPFPRGGVAPPFTWGSPAINAGSQLVRSKCGRGCIQRSLSNTDPKLLGLLGRLRVQSSYSKQSPSEGLPLSRTQAQCPLFLGCVISLNHCAPIS